MDPAPTKTDPPDPPGPAGRPGRPDLWSRARDAWHRRRGQAYCCPGCGYDLAGLATSDDTFTCPECGATCRRHQATPAGAAGQSWSFPWRWATVGTSVIVSIAISNPLPLLVGAIAMVDIVEGWIGSR